jgi:hypothetical protein
MINYLPLKGGEKMPQIIKDTESGKEKQTTYRTMIGKHQLAMKHGFYFEALLIDYAMLEDRMGAFLWSAGVMNDMDNYSIGNKRNKAILQQIITEYTGKKKPQTLKNISGKVEAIEALTDFAGKPYNGDNKYLIVLHEAMQSLDIENFSDTLTKIDVWRKYRNEVIHTAMNKNLSSLNDKLEENARLGMAYARAIDSASQKLKRRKNIRKSVSMPKTKM